MAWNWLRGCEGWDKGLDWTLPGFGGLTLLWVSLAWDAASPVLPVVCQPGPVCIIIFGSWTRHFSCLIRIRKENETKVRAGGERRQAKACARIYSNFIMHDSSMNKNNNDSSNNNNNTGHSHSPIVKSKSMSDWELIWGDWVRFWLWTRVPVWQRVAGLWIPFWIHRHSRPKPSRMLSHVKKDCVFHILILLV